MKPHMRLRFGVWSCVSFGPVAAVGCGETVREAYAEWEADCKRIGRFQ